MRFAGPSHLLDSAIGTAELLGCCPAAIRILLRGGRPVALVEAALEELAAVAAGAEGQSDAGVAGHDDGVHSSAAEQQS